MKPLQKRSSYLRCAAALVRNAKKHALHLTALKERAIMAQEFELAATLRYAAIEFGRVAERHARAKRKRGAR